MNCKHCVDTGVRDPLGRALMMGPRGLSDVHCQCSGCAKARVEVFGKLTDKEKRRAAGLNAYHMAMVAMGLSDSGIRVESKRQLSESELLSKAENLKRRWYILFS